METHRTPWRNRERESTLVCKTARPQWYKWLNRANSKQLSNLLKLRKILYEISKSQYVANNVYKDRTCLWGIDPSYGGLGLSIIEIKTGEIIVDRYTPGGDVSGNILNRTLLIADYIEKWYNLFPPLLVSMEYPFVPSGRMGSSIALYKLSHAIEVELYRLGGCLYKWLSPTSVKKFTVTKGSADKDMVMRQMLDEFGVHINNSDMADSLAICSISYVLFLIIKNINTADYNTNNAEDYNKLITHIGSIVFSKTDKSSQKRLDVVIDALLNPTYESLTMTDMVPDIHVVNIHRAAPMIVRHIIGKKKLLKLKTELSAISLNLGERTKE